MIERDEKLSAVATYLERLLHVCICNSRRFIEQETRDREISSVESLSLLGFRPDSTVIVHITGTMFRCFSIGWEILYGSACSMPIHTICSDMLYAM